MTYTHPRCFRQRWLALAALAAFLGSLPLSVRAQTLTMAQINQSVWANLYGVTQAELNSSVWLAEDSDGDGISNGAELAAGTNPFSAGSTIQITGMAVNGSNVTFTFPTINGKQYVLEQNSSVANTAGWQQVNGSTPANGTNAPASFTVPFAANTFYRVLVQDVDTTGGGVSNWAKINLGLDPNSTQSNGTTNSFGQYLTDLQYVSNQIAAQNAVSISATDAYATEPAVGSAASDFGTFTVSRGGLPAMLGAITVNVAIGGTAVANTDYAPLSSTVIIPAGVASVPITVTPLANANLKSGVTVTMTLQSGSGYTVGAPSSSGVLIYPAGTLSGTGLTGQYYNSGSTTYASNFTGTPVLTRVDPTVDFTFTTRPTGITSTTYTARWTGQVQPSYSELYYFEVDVRDGVALKVGGQTIINPATYWTKVSSLQTTVGQITLQAGVRYDIELDFLNVSAATTGQVHLKWYSYDQPEVVIPSTALYPTTLDPNAAPPAITSPLVAYAYQGQPFTFQITTSSNSPTTAVSIQSGSLPAGLSFSQTVVNGVNVGQITGTPTVTGDFPLVVQASNAAGTGSSVLDLQVLNTGGGITLEVWTGLNAASANVTNIPVNTTPNITGVLPSLQDNTTTYGNSYGERLQGYITVNTTGNYYFWIAGNDACQLWISDSSEVGAGVLRAYVNPPGLATPATPPASTYWTSQSNQQSGWIALTAGQKYYLQILHQGQNGTANNLAVAYMLDPTGTSTPSYTIVPGFQLWQFYAPPVSYSSQSGNPGALYFTEMGPENGAVTNGSGIATLQLNAAQTQATLNYSYAGLTTPLTQHHLHNDDYIDASGVLHPSSIIFDLDTAAPIGPNSYVWNITPTGTFANASDLVDVILQGKCYLNLHTVNYPAGEIRGNFTLANGAQTFVAPAPVTYTAPANPTTAQASRFLNQATFGADSADLATVSSGGFRAWLETQLAMAPTLHSTLIQKQTDGGTAYPETMTYNAWWQRSITAPDQVRQRVAFALSEIMVISSNGALTNKADALSSYYDTLLENAFNGADTGTSFRDLLMAVTLHPAMGIFLNMQGNSEGSLKTGVHANENYAREVHQLFSIGLNRLWPDGSLVLDSHFNLIPTYDQTFIQNVAPVFTGWNYYQAITGGRLPTTFNPAYDGTDQMVLVSTSHDLGAKQVLDNVWLPAATVTSQSNTATDPNSTYYVTNPGGSKTLINNLYDENGFRDLNAAVTSIFNHSNLGPFICRQLIQRLVTSNPSPAYVYRVTQAFNGQGNIDGVATNYRGDMKEVIRAILLDFEARDDSMLASTTFGKQREPLLRVTAAARYFVPTAPAAGTYEQPSTISSGHPSRIEVDFPQGSLPYPLVQIGDTVGVSFATVNSGHTLPSNPGNYGAFGGYTVRGVTSTGTGSTQQEKLEIDAFDELWYTYTWSGTTITISTSGTSPTASSDVPHNLAVGGSAYLVFAAPPTGSAPPNGIYKVVTVPNSLSFTVSTTSSGSASGTPNPDCVIHWIPNCGAISTSSTNPVTINTPVPHGLSVGSKVTITGAGVLTGATSYSVATVPTSTSFTIANPGLGSVNDSGITVWPQVPMDGMTGTGQLGARNGTLTASTSTWTLDYTDTNQTADVMQTPLRAPTVFNFFYPTYTYPGALAYGGVTVPEFQLTSDANTMALTNFLEHSLYNGLTGGYTNGLASFRSGSEDVMMDLSGFMSYLSANGGVGASSSSNPGVTALLTKLSNEMMGGEMTSGMQNAILGYVTTANFPSTSATQIRDAVRAVTHFVLISPEFAIQR